MKRPKHLDPPTYLSKSPPLPTPRETADDVSPMGEDARPNPTRYGDWEKKGVAIDF